MYESAECQSIGPRVCEILNFDILKKFSFLKTIPVFDFHASQVGGPSVVMYMYIHIMTFVTSSD